MKWCRGERVGAICPDPLFFSIIIKSIKNMLQFINRYVLYQFQIKDEIKAARIEATKAYNTYIEEPKTSQRR
jgi:hypothetical protein